MSGRWFLLADRPGWRASEILSSGTTRTEGRLRLADLAAPSVLDCPPAAWVSLPCCERAELRPQDRTVVLVAGTGQVRAVAGPWGVVRDEHGEATVRRVAPARRVPDDGCLSVLDWPGDAWNPSGLVCLDDGMVGVLDTDAGLVHVLDRFGALRGVLPAAAVAGCPAPDGAVRYARSGTAVTVALDSQLPGCRWHRVVVAGKVPQGSAVEVSVLVTDADLGEGEVAVLDASRWSALGVFGDPALDRWDCLVRAPRGRFLWLRLTLRGDGTVTPLIDDVEVHFPRDTSLRFLPSVYAAGEADDLDRLLALTDTVRDGVVAHVEGFAHQLDARSADASRDHDLLGWLGTWVGMTGMGALPEERRRRLVGAAAELYRRRGTPDGVARHVGLWLDRRTDVLEHYRLRRWAVLDEGRLGDATRLFGREIVGRLQLDGGSAIGAFRLVSTPSPRLDPFAVYAHRFTLFVHARECDDPDALAASAAAVVAAIQPAHTVSSVAVVTATARVEQQATLGLDAVIAGPLPPARLGDRLGDAQGTGLAGTTTIARDPRRGDLPAIGIDARVGTRAVLG
jgi:phage tail-like protein